MSISANKTSHTSGFLRLSTASIVKKLELSENALIDGHTHSSASDGTQSPRELMWAAARAGVAVLALTDHDTLAGWVEAAAAVSETGVGLIRGVEISAARGRHTAHILGYLPDPTHPDLLAIFRQMQQTRVERLKIMVTRLQADYPKISWQFVVEQAADQNVPLGRPHLADALIEAGYYLDRDAAFVDALSYRSPYYVHYQAPDIVHVVAAIRAARGVPVLAHPRSVRRARSLTESELVEMVDVGLWGLEQRHRENSAAGKTELTVLAQRYGLELTGGSDYHGSGKPNQLGENTLSVYQLEYLAANGAIPVLLP